MSTISLPQMAKLYSNILFYKKEWIVSVLKKKMDQVSSWLYKNDVCSPPGLVSWSSVINNSLLFIVCEPDKKNLYQRNKDKTGLAWAGIYLTQLQLYQPTAALIQKFLCYLLNIAFFWWNRSWGDRGESCSGCGDAHVAFMPKHKFYNGSNTCLQLLSGLLLPSIK